MSTSPSTYNRQRPLLWLVSLAIFMHSGGQIDLKHAGESIELPTGAMRVETIESSRVILSGEGGPMTLQLAGTEAQ